MALDPVQPENTDSPRSTEFQTQSESISKIALALSKAQAKITAAKRTSENPFFKSKYADLNSVWESLRAPLSEQELAVVQTPIEDEKGIAIITTLAHSSGEWFRSKLYIAPKAKDAQSIGSAITYARRYALAAITGVAPDDDDDGNAAAGHDQNGHASQNGHSPKTYPPRNLPPPKPAPAAAPAQQTKQPAPTTTVETADPIQPTAPEGKEPTITVADWMAVEMLRKKMNMTKEALAFQLKRMGLARGADLPASRLFELRQWIKGEIRDLA